MIRNHIRILLCELRVLRKFCLSDNRQHYLACHIRNLWALR